MNRIILALFISVICVQPIFGQIKSAETTDMWCKVEESLIPKTGKRYIFPSKYVTFKLNLEKLNKQLANLESSLIPNLLSLPLNDSCYINLQIKTNETMSAGLQKQFPQIRTFDGTTMDNSGITAKIDFTPQGFHAMIMRPGQSTIFIDPYVHLGNNEYYIIYSRDNFQTSKTFNCEFENDHLTDNLLNNEVKSFGNCTKKTYRLALAATAEYTQFHGGTILQAQAAQITTINRVNGVYMRDLAVTLSLIPNNNLLIYVNPLLDPYANGNPGLMIAQNQINTTNVIGSSNYDIGHVFGTNSGGLAGLGVVCNSSLKARGVTGSAAPIGDPFDIDYVAHEIGHEFSGNHSFRGSVGACSGNFNNTTAMEPGSGSTIMAYAGICAPQNIQNNSNDYFHGVNLAEIHQFLLTTGNTCANSSVIPNQTSPTISINNTYTIPISTPFALTATASDLDGDILTYCWEQMDNENSPQPPLSTNINGPNFRSFLPSTNGTRYIPTISTQISGINSPWEVLPNVSRTINFRCVVRDNEIGGGCNDFADLSINVTSAAGPFLVNYPNSSGIQWSGNSVQPIYWSVANTNNSPVACSEVDIYISIDGGLNFEIVANDVPNDGYQDITVPNVSTNQAIIMVMCNNGTFFDISNNLFSIVEISNDFDIILNSTTILTCQGLDESIVVNINEIGSFNSPITLSATGIPNPAIVSFNPNPILPGDSSIMTISNTSGMTSTTSNFNVVGTSSSVSHSVPGIFTIISPLTTATILDTPQNESINNSLQPLLNWSNSTPGVTYEVIISTDSLFSNIVENTVGLNTTTYSTIQLNQQTTYYWKVITTNSCSLLSDTTITFSFTTGNCSQPDIPTIAGEPTICNNGWTSITITSGYLNDAVNWIWYMDSCGGIYTGTGQTIILDSPGTYFVRGEGGCVNNANCQSFTIQQQNSNVNINFENNSLIAEPTGDSYQWFNCDNMEIVSTNQSFNPTNNGSYAVILNTNNCSDTSDCFYYNSAELIETIKNTDFIIFPNPTNGCFEIVHSSINQIEYIRITDISGRLIKEFKPISLKNIFIDLTNESCGMYYIQCNNGNLNQTLKVLKE